MNPTNSENRYSLETLLPLNELYHHDHRLTQEDVDMSNKLVRHIERTRNPHVQKVGDRVRYTTRYGDFYGNALLEAVRKDGTFSICLCPYVPFVWATAGRYRLRGERRTFYGRGAARAAPGRNRTGGFLRLGTLRRLRQRCCPVLRRGAAVGVPGAGTSLRRFHDRAVAQNPPS